MVWDGLSVRARVVGSELWFRRRSDTRHSEQPQKGRGSPLRRDCSPPRHCTGAAQSMGRDTAMRRHTVTARAGVHSGTERSTFGHLNNRACWAGTLPEPSWRVSCRGRNTVLCSLLLHRTGAWLQHTRVEGARAQRAALPGGGTALACGSGLVWLVAARWVVRARGPGTAVGSTPILRSLHPNCDGWGRCGTCCAAFKVLAVMRWPPSCTMRGRRAGAVGHVA